MMKNKIIIAGLIIVAVLAVVVFVYFSKDKSQESVKQSADGIPMLKISDDSKQTGGDSEQSNGDSEQAGMTQEEINEINSIIDDLNSLNSSAQGLDESADLEGAYSN